MARLITSGAEWNDFTAEQCTFVGGAAFSQAVVRSGSYSFVSTAADEVRFTPAGALGTAYYFRSYFYLDTPSYKAFNALDISTTAPARIGAVAITSSGFPQCRYGSGSTTLATGASPVPLQQWFMLELSCLVQVGGGSTGIIIARFNGVEFANGTSLDLGSTAPGRFSCVLGSGGTAQYADDIAINDNASSPHNSWPGTGKVVLLTPVKDQAAGAGWTLGTGTAIAANAFDSLNNKPPVGVADLTAGSDPKQVRNAAANANSDLDIQLQSFASYGMVSGDTISVLREIVATGAPVATQAKQGTIGIAAPAGVSTALTALGAGGTAGAFWSGVAAGTYPTGWKWTIGPGSDNISFDYTSAPILRIRQVTSSTRIAIVCAAGLYVDYVPGTPSPSKIAYGLVESGPIPGSIKCETGFQAGQNFYTGVRYAQTFTMLTNSGILDSVELYLAKNGTPGADATIEIAPDSSGAPGTTLYSTTINEADVNTYVTSDDIAWKIASISGFLTAGQVYWLVLSSTAPNDSNSFVIGRTGVSVYSGGAAYGDIGSGWVDVGSKDYMFRINFGYGH